MSEPSFAAAIRDNPAVDAPRLVFADWLEELGDPRSEFIRLQCELSQLAATDPRRHDLYMQLASYRGSFVELIKPLSGLVQAFTCERGVFVGAIVASWVLIERGHLLFRAAPTITRLQVNQSAGHVREFAMLPFLSQVTELNFDGNHFGDSGLQALADSPYLSQLRMLDVTRNDISDMGVEHLLRSSSLRSLTTINLRGNEISRRMQSALRLRFGPEISF
jgi:uncharacterized protein (TIGR02996 family)